MKDNLVVLLNAKAQRSQRIAKKREILEIIIHENEKMFGVGRDERVFSTLGFSI